MTQKFVVSCTSGLWQIPFIEYLKMMNYQIIAVDAKNDAPGFLLADFVICEDLNEIALICEEIRRITSKVDFAFSYCSDIGLPLAGEINRIFETGKSFEMDEAMFTRKSKQRSRLLEAGNEFIPEFDFFTNPASAKKYCLEKTLPLVIKPDDSSGSRGVTILRDYLNLDKSIYIAFDQSKNKKIVIESFIPGTEYTVEVLASNFMIFPMLITRKIKISARETVASELWSVDPQSEIWKLISEVAVEAYLDLGLKNGPGHIEIIFEESTGRVGIVEAAARGGGFNLASKMIAKTTNVSYMPLLLDSMNGRFAGSESTGYTPSVLFFYPSKKGKLLSIKGIAEASKLPGVSVQLLSAEGEMFDDAESDGDRICSVLISAKNEKNLHEMKTFVESLIIFEFGGLHEHI